MIRGSDGIAEAVNYIEIVNYHDILILKRRSKLLKEII